MEYDDERPPILKEKEIPGIKVVGHKNRREEVERAEAPAFEKKHKEERKQQP